MEWKRKQVRRQAESLLPLAEKHHVTKVTKGGYYGCFRSQHGEERKCVHNSWQMRWILLVEGISLVGNIQGDGLKFLGHCKCHFWSRISSQSS